MAQFPPKQASLAVLVHQPGECFPVAEQAVGGAFQRSGLLQNTQRDVELRTAGTDQTGDLRLRITEFQRYTPAR